MKPQIINKTVILFVILVILFQYIYFNISLSKLEIFKIEFLEFNICFIKKDFFIKILNLYIENTLIFVSDSNVIYCRRLAPKIKGEGSPLIFLIFFLYWLFIIRITKNISVFKNNLIKRRHAPVPPCLPPWWQTYIIVPLIVFFINIVNPFVIGFVWVYVGWKIKLFLFLNYYFFENFTIVKFVVNATNQVFNLLNLNLENFFFKFLPVCYIFTNIFLENILFPLWDSISSYFCNFKDKIIFKEKSDKKFPLKI